MASSKKPSLFISLLLLLLVVSAVHGAQPADAGDTAGGAERVAVRSSGHGHGYSSSHSGGHTSGGTGTPEQGGAGSVDPRNLNARSHHRSGAASRAGLGYSSPVAWGLVGAILAVALLP
ncbi:holotricin-3-like isoform X2 [Panicum virgatum]|uniref:Uncharacterized protein n=1 Tax=Panicum virgatum TaxID=38727 RepID=A0A8T0V7X0_PANVG|nr:holotricin-3-like isoform X2 [Panicum virgatum]KAG2632492.1 hypothetical protein PVAP13_2NG111100 [Panicum virgatum]